MRAPSCLLVAVLVAGTARAEPPAALPCLDGDVAGMACVPGGPARRGTDEEHRCGQGENIKRKTRFGPATEVWIQTFYMDKSEVTIEAWAACVRAGKCKKAGPLYNDFSRPAQPITAVSWFQARDYCAAQGKRLPTEAEWEKAARGPLEGPDADAQAGTCPDVVIMSEAGRSCGTPKAGSHPEKGRVLEVKRTPAGPYGLFEMRGNAEEWVDDWFAADLAACGAACAGVDPRGPCPGASTCAKHPLKMVKGGSWYWPAADARAWHRRPWTPTNKPAHHFGFRCAASVEQASALAPTP